MAAATKRIHAAGGATRTRVRDRSRSAGKRAHAIGVNLRSSSAAGRDEALASVRRTTGELADLAQTAADDTQRLLTVLKPEADAQLKQAEDDEYGRGPIMFQVNLTPYTA